MLCDYRTDECERFKELAQQIGTLL